MFAINSVCRSARLCNASIATVVFGDSWMTNRSRSVGPKVSGSLAPKREIMNVELGFARNTWATMASFSATTVREKYTLPGNSFGNC